MGSKSLIWWSGFWKNHTFNLFEKYQVYFAQQRILWKLYLWINFWKFGALKAASILEINFKYSDVPFFLPALHGYLKVLSKTTRKKFRANLKLINCVDAQIYICKFWRIKMHFQMYFKNCFHFIECSALRLVSVSPVCK